MIRAAPSVLRAPDDLELAKRCVAGDRPAQRELFSRHKRRVHATLYRMLGSSALDDLIQDTFVAVFRGLGSFRGESSLATWIDRCTVRIAFAYLSEKRARPPHLELVGDVATGDPSAERRLVAREAARRMYAELDRMEPKMRLAFTLHVIEGRSMNEIALVMEASLVATKTRVWRARREMEKRARRDPTLAGYLSNDTRDDEEGEGA